jgi:hypothetical protein
MKFIFGLEVATVEYNQPAEDNKFNLNAGESPD